MASSASATPSSPISTPLSPAVADEDNDNEETTRRRTRRLRKRILHNNSSPSSPLIVEEPHQGKVFRKGKTQRNRTLQKWEEQNRISHFSQESSSSDENDLVGERRQRRSLSRLRKSNRIISTPFPTTETPFSKKSTEQYSNNYSYFPFNHHHNHRFHPVQLSWNEQGTEIATEIASWYKYKQFVDVTLVVDNPEGNDRVEIGVHKIVLAGYSNYFKKILEETPSTHAVMLLKDFTKWEIESIVEFMYKGEVNVGSDQVKGLLRTAAALQIRGIAECLGEMSSGQNETSSDQSRDNEQAPSGGQGSPGLLNLSISGGWEENESVTMTQDRNGPQTARGARAGFPIQPYHHPSFTQQQAASPPFPRRKQARPRRRSGDFVAQDLRLTPPESLASLYRNVPPFITARNGDLDEDDDAVLDFTIGHNRNQPEQEKVRDSTGFKSMEKVREGVEALGMKNLSKNWQFRPLGLNLMASPPPQLTQRHQTHVKTESEFEIHSPHHELQRISPPVSFEGAPRDQKRPKGRPGTISSLNGHRHLPPGFFKGSPPSPPFSLNFNDFLPHNSDSESNNLEPCSTPPKVSSPAAYHSMGRPHSAGGTKRQRNGDASGDTWAGLPVGPAPIFGRHRAQHSAPRGGPPRAWSNADLTQALDNVWNKKMTTSQASRIFGIPYNSLLMYVRGKYGKSLHLDVLKRGVDMALESKAAAAAAAAAKGSPKGKGQSAGRRSSSPAGSPPSNNNPTPPHNNNNTITSKGSKVKGEGSPPAGNLNLSSLLGQGLSGGLSPEPIRPVHRSPEMTNLNELMPPSGFNPFAMAGIFGDYPPPFPFPTVAAANAALSHLLPPHHPHHLINNGHRRVHQHSGPSEK